MFIWQLRQVLFASIQQIWCRHVIIFKRLIEPNGRIYVYIELARYRLIAAILVKY